MDFTAKDFIILENQDFALINKPVGIDSEHAMGEGFYPVHRLDKVASGLLLYAKSPMAARKLSRALQEGKIKKKYHILVESASVPSETADKVKSLQTANLHGEDSSIFRQLPKEGRFSDYLYKDTKKQKMFPVKKLRKGVKEAVLHYQVLEEREGLALVDVELETGRFHQIRAQFSAHGFPLFGDGKYGSRLKGNVALHCYTLSFPDPKNGKELHFQIEDRNEEPWVMFQQKV